MIDISMLNDQQVKAVTCPDQHIVCLAGAGTGKTLSLIKRIEYLVDKGVDPNSILVLTFTNAAAFEMKERYSSSNRYTPSFKTFHAFCYSLLITDRNFRKILGYNTIPAILSEEEEKALNKKVMVITNTKPNSSKNPKDVSGEIFQKAKIKMLQKENKITFDILCKSVCNLFKSDVKSCKKYKDKYKYIFVDEFQDTDQTQWDFVRSFIDSSIFVVGDVLQNIYSFRGTTNSIIKELVDSADWTTIKLLDNYRSTSNIVDYVNTFSNYADSSYRLSFTASRKGNKAVKELFGWSYDLLQTPDMLNYVKNSTDCAILCRTNKEVYNVKTIMKKNNISISNSISKDVIRFIKSRLDKNYCIQWLSSYLLLEDYTKYITKTTDEDGNTVDNYSLKQFLDDFSNSSYMIKKNAKLLKDYEKLCKKYNGWESFLLDLENLFNTPLSYLQLDDTVDTLEDAELSIINRLSNDTIRTNGIYVGTIHSSKGLEYDDVIVFGAGGKQFPLKYEENKNLFYVAITRAKNTLVVFRED